jgi:hypothetical protein
MAQGYLQEGACNARRSKSRIGWHCCLGSLPFGVGYFLFCNWFICKTDVDSTIVWMERNMTKMKESVAYDEYVKEMQSDDDYAAWRIEQELKDLPNTPQTQQLFKSFQDIFKEQK